MNYILAFVYFAFFLQVGTCLPLEARKSQPIYIQLYSQPNCQGDQGTTTYAEGAVITDTSTKEPRLSFKISRPLRPHEQIDFSVAPDLSTWTNQAPNHISCGNFVRTFFARDKIGTTCQNFGPFTCYKIWANPGLVSPVPWKE
ncbi:hypothetical protein BJX70DRAFT_399682 [Aspergillus crustosus]